ncbi:hypothetical protein E4U43_003691 [Claviceps pusilla]|uniref:SCP domain-containing protein n=1 Tax=Claviceps pusilla TaxID=123648 RepID=A0A9P7NFC8_9HYPO|nr:hypothetical protein E4U43_003691 [Claviceps pusilla]
MVTITLLPPNQAQWTTPALFTSAILNSTNFYRRAHNASDLHWNHTLADFARNHLLDKRGGGGCLFAHSGGPYGENLARGYADVTASVEAWGEEAAAYDYRGAAFSLGTGHFTQLVWKDTTDVGCGRRWCGREGWYLVCEYWPRGNIVGRFAEEVDGEVSGGGRGAPSMMMMMMMMMMMGFVFAVVVVGGW